MKCLTYFELSWVSRFELWNFLRSEQRAAHNNNNNNKKEVSFEKTFIFFIFIVSFICVVTEICYFLAKRHILTYTDMVHG